MQNFDFYSPTYFAFGKGKEKETGTLVKRFGGTKVLLHYGGGSIKKNGAYDSVVRSLNEAGIPFVELGGVKPNPRSGLVYEGIELCRKEGVDFILAVGGGSSIDSAKAIALGVPYEGDFWDFYETDRIVTEALPVGTVLTIAAAGSEGSSGSVITKEESLLKWSAGGDAIRPKFSILNPEYTCTLGAYQTACGITDILVHVMERYFTNTRYVETTDRVCEAIMNSVITEAPKVMGNLQDYEARANIMWAGMIAHNNIAGVGREQDWATHDMEHELSAFYDCAHGAGLAVLSPAWMKYVYKQDVMRFAQFAVRVWGCSMDFADPERTALEGIARWEHFLQSIGMPLSLEDLGAREEDIPKMVEHLSKRGGIGRFVRILDKEAEDIFRLAVK